MTPSQIVLGGGFCILLPKTTKRIYGCFLGNIDDGDHWISGHFSRCQDGDGRKLTYRKDQACLVAYDSCSTLDFGRCSIGKK